MSMFLFFFFLLKYAVSCLALQNELHSLSINYYKLICHQCCEKPHNIAFLPSLFTPMLFNRMKFNLKRRLCDVSVKHDFNDTWLWNISQLRTVVIFLFLHLLRTGCAYDINNAHIFMGKLERQDRVFVF